MNALAPFLSETNILLDLGGAEAASFLGEIARRVSAGGLPAERIAVALREREALGSTGLGRGVALPHARIAGLTRVVAAFARPELPVEYGAPDGKPVSEAFVLLVPEEATEQHLQLLATIAGLCSDRQFRARLRELDERAAIHQLCTSWIPPV